MHTGGARDRIAIKVFGGCHGEQCVMLSVEEVWVLRVYMGSMWLSWESIFGNASSNLSYLFLAFLKRDIFLTITYQRLEKVLKPALFGQVYGRQKSNFLMDFDGL